MYDTYEYEKIIATRPNTLFVDVRTPDEYERSTIPGAINLPLLVNEERIQIGILYKDGNLCEAKQLGIDYVSTKLPRMFHQYQSLCKEHGRLAVFCARGGYRSSSLVSLLYSLDLPVIKVQGGYKSYRSYVLRQLDKELDEIETVTIYGNTGTGKTKILNCLQKMGADVLQLEHYANHKGSLLGSIGLGKPYSQKMFESLLLQDLLKRRSNMILVEGESRRIGNVVLPVKLYQKMINGKKIQITASLEDRLTNLKEDYLQTDLKEILTALEKLKAYLPAEKVDEYQRLLRHGKADSVIMDLCQHYYDPRYGGQKKKDYWLYYENKNHDQTAKNILDDIRSALDK